MNFSRVNAKRMITNIQNAGRNKEWSKGRMTDGLDEWEEEDLSA